MVHMDCRADCTKLLLPFFVHLFDDVKIINGLSVDEREIESFWVMMIVTKNSYQRKYLANRCRNRWG